MNTGMGLQKPESDEPCVQGKVTSYEPKSGSMMIYVSFGESIGKWISVDWMIPERDQKPVKEKCLNHWTGGLLGICPDCGER